MSSSKIVLFSDGGGERQSSAAGACIVHGCSRAPLKLVVWLGGATNNEGELSAGLLGFSALLAMGIKPTGIQTLHWVADSKYVLDGATKFIRSWQKNGWVTSTKEPVKNQGLWKTFLELSKSWKIDAEFVRGHTGHVENELCDQASTWARVNCGSLPDLFRDGPVTRKLLDSKLGEWILIDGRSIIRSLRGDDPETIDKLAFYNYLNQSGLLLGPEGDRAHKSMHCSQTDIERDVQETKPIDPLPTDEELSDSDLCEPILLESEVSETLLIADESRVKLEALLFLAKSVMKLARSLAPKHKEAKKLEHMLGDYFSSL